MSRIRLFGLLSIKTVLLLHELSPPGLTIPSTQSPAHFLSPLRFSLSLEKVALLRRPPSPPFFAALLRRPLSPPSFAASSQPLVLSSLSPPFRHFALHYNNCCILCSRAAAKAVPGEHEKLKRIYSGICSADPLFVSPLNLFAATIPMSRMHCWCCYAIVLCVRALVFTRESMWQQFIWTNVNKRSVIRRSEHRLRPELAK